MFYSFDRFKRTSMISLTLCSSTALLTASELLERNLSDSAGSTTKPLLNHVTSKLMDPISTRWNTLSSKTQYTIIGASVLGVSVIGLFGLYKYRQYMRKKKETNPLDAIIPSTLTSIPSILANEEQEPESIIPGLSNPVSATIAAEILSHAADSGSAHPLSDAATSDSGSAQLLSDAATLDSGPTHLLSDAATSDSGQSTSTLLTSEPGSSKSGRSHKHKHHDSKKKKQSNVPLLSSAVAASSHEHSHSKHRSSKQHSLRKSRSAMPVTSTAAIAVAASSSASPSAHVLSELILEEHNLKQIKATICEGVAITVSRVPNAAENIYNIKLEHAGKIVSKASRNTAILIDFAKEELQTTFGKQLNEADDHNLTNLFNTYHQ